MWVWTGDKETAEEIDTKLRPSWAAWVDELPEPQRQALRDYKSGKYLLYSIAKDTGGSFSEEERDRFAVLDKAFAFAPTLDQATVAWRGIFRSCGVTGGPPTWELPAVEAVEPLEGWTSVSLLQKPAVSEAYLWGDMHPNDRSVLWQLLLPAGLPHIYIEAVKPANSHEAELLLPRGLKYQVTAAGQVSAFPGFFDFKRDPEPRAHFVAGKVLCCDGATGVSLQDA